MKHQFTIWGVLFLLFLSGCGRNMPLSGKVTFEDGSPLTSGTIIFESDKTLSRGIIKENGTFVIGTEKTNNGLPKGEEFTICITGAYEPLPPGAGMVVPVPLIAAKYNSAKTSGLTFHSDGKTRNFDIVVERPDPVEVDKIRKAIKNAPKQSIDPGA